MAEDYRIIVQNGLGSGGAKGRLSAKSSIAKRESTLNSRRIAQQVSSKVNQAISHTEKGGSTGIMASGVGKAGVASTIIGALLTTAEKVASFGITWKEAETGNSVRAHNSRTTLKTITSLGTNYVYGALNMELIQKKEISRQNNGLDYGRELYAINVEGSKNKRI